MTGWRRDLVRVARTLGVILLIGAPALAFGAWDSTRQPLATFERMQKNRMPADSLAYEHAAFHAELAGEMLANKWHLTGFASLGLLGTITGAGMVYLSLRMRRRLVERPAEGNAAQPKTRTE